AMQAGKKFGMQTMNQSLAELVQKRRISREEALNRSTLPEELAGLLGSAGAASGSPAAAARAGGSPLGRRWARGEGRGLPRPHFPRTKMGKRPPPKIALKSGGKVKDKEMAIFPRQFSTMI